MSAGRSASFCLMVCFLLCSSEALENITADVGHNVTLPCKVDNNKPIKGVEWNRPGPKKVCVLLYRNEKFISKYQDTSYVNRVDLQDKEMKNGDVSMILKNVTMNDNGTYECRVFQRETNRRKRSILETKIINLVVGPSGGKDGGDKDGGGKAERHKDGGDKDGGDKDRGDKVGGDNNGRANTGIIAVVPILLAVMASVGFLIYKRRMRQNSNPPVPPDESAEEQMV